MDKGRFLHGGRAEKPTCSKTEFTNSTEVATKIAFYKRGTIERPICSENTLIRKSKEGEVNIVFCKGGTKSGTQTNRETA